MGQGTRGSIWMPPADDEEKESPTRRESINTDQTSKN